MIEIFMMYLEVMSNVDFLSQIRFIKAKHQVRGNSSLMGLVNLSADCQCSLKFSISSIPSIK